MTTLAVGIFGFDWIVIGHREQCVEAVHDVLGSLRFVFTCQSTLFCFFDGSGCLNFSRIEGGFVCLVATEYRHSAFIVGIASTIVTHPTFCLASSHIPGFKFRILLQDCGEVLNGFTELSRAHVQQRAVIDCHEIRWIDFQHIAEVVDGFVVVTDLGSQQTSVEMCLLACRFQADGIVIVGHSSEIIVKIVLHVCTVNEVACITRFQQDGAVHVGNGALEVLV